MLSSINNFLGFDRGCIPEREYLVIVRNTDTGCFLVHQIISAAVKEKRPVCLVSFNETFHNYNAVSQKIGVNLKNAAETKHFAFYDGMEELSQCFFPESSQPSLKPKSILRVLQQNICELVEDLRDNSQMDPVLVVDEISALLCFGFSVSDILKFAMDIQYKLLQPKSQLNTSSLAISCASYSNDSNSVCLWKCLTRLSSIEVNITGLETFYCKDVHGQAQVTWRDGIETPRQHSTKTLQFKLMDNSVDFFAPGTSAAVL